MLDHDYMQESMHDLQECSSTPRIVCPAARQCLALITVYTRSSSTGTQSIRQQQVMLCWSMWCNCSACAWLENRDCAKHNNYFTKGNGVSAQTSICCTNQSRVVLSLPENTSRLAATQWLLECCTSTPWILCVGCMPYKLAEVGQQLVATV